MSSKTCSPIKFMASGNKIKNDLVVDIEKELEFILHCKPMTLVGISE